MNCYFLAKIFIMSLPSFYVEMSDSKFENIKSMDVKYEIFHDNTHPGFKHSNDILYKKAPNVIIKVFNK